MPSLIPIPGPCAALTLCPAPSRMTSGRFALPYHVIMHIIRNGKVGANIRIVFGAPKEEGAHVMRGRIINLSKREMAASEGAIESAAYTLKVRRFLAPNAADPLGEATFYVLDDDHNGTEDGYTLLEPDDKNLKPAFEARVQGAGGSQERKRKAAAPADNEQRFAGEFVRDFRLVQRQVQPPAAAAAPPPALPPALPPAAAVPPPAQVAVQQEAAPGGAALAAPPVGMGGQMLLLDQGGMGLILSLAQRVDALETKVSSLQAEVQASRQRDVRNGLRIIQTLSGLYGAEQG
jgi:hypothetical protein